MGVLVALWLLPHRPWIPPLAALATVLGHCYPVYLAFRGGKGVATAAGAFLPLAPGVTAGALGVFAVILLAFRRVSAASMAAAGSFPLLAWALGRNRLAVVGGALAGLIIWRHRENLRRLAVGDEPRLGTGEGK